jgi:hypothetical protein
LPVLPACQQEAANAVRPNLAGSTATFGKVSQMESNNLLGFVASSSQA